MLAKAAADVDPAYLRHLHVEEREGWCLLLADRQSLFAVPCEQYLVALVVDERHLQQREHLGSSSASRTLLLNSSIISSHPLVAGIGTPILR